jgi:RNA recognition motif-containing protein
MNRKLYVGNLAFATEERTIEALFGEVGPVTSVRLMRDKITGQSRGFGFVEMESEDGAQAAIDRLHEKDLDGRKLTVNEARPQVAGGFGGDRAGGFGGERAAGGGFGGRRRESRW